MAREITKGNRLQHLTEELGIQSLEGMPTRVSDVVAPTYPVQQRFITIVKAYKDVANGATLFTPTQGRQFVLCYAALYITRDNACDCTDYRVNVFDSNHIQSQIIRVGGITGGIMNGVNAIWHPAYPMLLSKQAGSIISTTNAKTAGNHIVTLSIGGYYLY